MKKNLVILAAITCFIGYAVVSIWTLTQVDQLFPWDLGIYLRAGGKILRSEDPYQPFSIGASFVYPPTALLLFAPLSSIQSVQLLWAALSLASLVAAIWILAPIFRPSTRAIALLAFIAAMALFTPSLETLTIGQIDFVILLGLALFVRGYLDQKYEWPGDLGLALAISIKMSPIILVALPFFSRDWKRCLRIAIGLAGLVTITFIVWGQSPWVSFWQVLPTILNGFPFTINEAISPTLQWLVSRAGVTTDISWIGGVFSGVALLIWLGTTALWHRKKPAPALLGLGISTMVISSSLIWFHHLTFLIIPFAYLVLSAGAQVRWEAGVMVCAVIAFGLVHIDRLIEFPLVLPPFAAIVGYLLLFSASLTKVIRMESQPLSDRWNHCSPPNFTPSRN